MTVYGTRRTPPPEPAPGSRRTLLLIVAALAVVLVGGGGVGAAILLRGHGTQTASALPSATPAHATAASPTASPSAAPAGSTFTLSAVGDTIVAAAPNLPPNGGRGFFNDVRDALAADLQMGNLEEPITDVPTSSKCSAASLGKTCHAFRAPTSYVRALTEAGFSLMNLANNHAMDFGDAGHKQTETTLTAAGIKYTGPPGMITTTTVKGVTVAVVGFAPYNWANSLLDIPGAAELVRTAKGQADIVIVQAHVGAERSHKTHVRPRTEHQLRESRGASLAAGDRVLPGREPGRLARVRARGRRRGRRSRDHARPARHARDGVLQEPLDRVLHGQLRRVPRAVHGRGGRHQRGAAGDAGRAGAL